jgi:uncharacterized protein YbgA (DUF1722 family)/uncharacterized protein YbbK (DUF523 family)
MSTEGRLRLGVSACLLGRKVRYDGGHKLDPFLVETLGAFVEYVPVCPEVEAGLGVPRERMHLEGDPDSPRLVTSLTGVDLTARMQAWAEKRLDELAGEELCGFIFKSASPSSGMERVKVATPKGPVHRGRGLFAAAFMERFPLLPAEDDGRLHDPDLRENFIERVFTLRRYRDAIAPGEQRAGRQTGKMVGALVAFHTAHKLLLMAHSPKHYREMGALVAHGREVPAAGLLPRYEALLMEALSLSATPGKHANVLAHIKGYFRDRLTADEKAEWDEVVGSYRRGLVPLVVPVTLARHHVRRFAEPWLSGQVYLDPHPAELMLRNHA